MMFGGPKVNNVLASMTDKIVCATFSADPNMVAEEDEEEEDKEGKQDPADRVESSADEVSVAAQLTNHNTSPVSALAPASSLALAAAPLLTSDFAFDTRGSTALRIYSAPTSRRCSDQPLSDVSSPMSVQLSLVGDHTNSGALFYQTPPNSRPTASISVHSLCHLPLAEEGTTMTTSFGSGRRLSESGLSDTPAQEQQHQRSPRARRKPNEAVEQMVDHTVRSAHVTPESTPANRSLSSSRSRINTEDREHFTEEVTV